MTDEAKKREPYLPTQESLHSRALPIIELPSASIFYRIHPAKFSPFHFPNRHNMPDHRPRYRFDDPRADFGVMYMSRQKVGAFAETISRQFFGVDPEYRILFWSDYKDRKLSKIRCAQPLSLVSLTGDIDLARLGVDSQLTSTDDYSWGQSWSRLFYDHPDQVDGICYPARHAPETQSVALFDRALTQSFEITASFRLTPDETPMEILEYLAAAEIGISP